MIRKSDYEVKRTRYESLIKRQLELEIQIRANQSDKAVLSALRTEYREVNQEIFNILSSNILESENGPSH